MKQIKIYLFALLAVLSMAACSSDDGDGNGSNEINTNKNEVTTDKAVTRLEFPKLKAETALSVFIVTATASSTTRTT